tara:strand:+ start:2471 stop:3409 length:939 start_codon:yes stop_codon:yes gene_type:complete
MKKNILCITPITHLPGVFEELKKYGNITYMPNIKSTGLRQILKEKNFNAIFVNPNKQGFKIGKKILMNTNLEVINTCSTGTNHIDLEFCNNNKIKIWSLTNDYQLIKKLPSTSELAFGLMILLLRKIIFAHNSVSNYKWDYLPYIGNQIENLKIGVVGYGRLGKIFCKQLEGFNANITICDPYVKNTPYKNLELRKLAKKVDVLVLHLHVKSETKGFINEEIIKSMKKGSIIINTSRGELVDENAILKYLKLKHLGGYGTDVLTNEFDNIKKSKLIKYVKKLPIVITPHIGGMTIQGQTKAFMHAVKKFRKL